MSNGQIARIIILFISFIVTIALLENILDFFNIPENSLLGTLIAFAFGGIFFVVGDIFYSKALKKGD